MQFLRRIRDVAEITQTVLGSATFRSVGKSQAANSKQIIFLFPIMSQLSSLLISTKYNLASPSSNLV
jgi:hypothetical protein